MEARPWKTHLLRAAREQSYRREKKRSPAQLRNGRLGVPASIINARDRDEEDGFGDHLKIEVSIAI